MPASKKEAKEFVKRWQKRLAAIPAGSNNEQQDTQKFWVDLLINVLGIPSNTIDSFVDFERKVRGRRIDVFVSDHNFLCEQKSWGIDLDKPEPRNGGMETPLQQAMWYARHLPYSERPRWVMTCNFGTFRLYDLDNERPEDTVQEFSLEELQDSLYLLSFLTSNETSRLHKEQQLSIEAGAYVSRLYDALAKQYHHIEEKDERAQEEQRSLNVLITRIIFLLYAEDADLLQSHQAFGRYCEGDPAKLRRKLVDLFEAIDTPLDKRDEYMDEDLAAFPYVNGGLFADSSIIVPQMTPEILEAITDASQDFDWREISGVIFGGVFEGTLNPETRHAGGMHYTSVENIERCLKPLFLDELWDELHEAEGERTATKRKQALARLHDKVASITIGDPACGSGNFLTEAYRQLRTIENRIIEDELSEETGNAGQTSLVIAQDSPVRVSLDQLYGIEINDFAVSVAKTALWITEEQMLRKTQEIYVGYDFDFLPLRSLSNLHEGNALKTDWSEVFPDDLTYLVGNPPFLGARNQSKEQKAELLEVFDGAKNAGNIDYCGAWYMKAARFTQGKRTRCALVSTNSICQGKIWIPLHGIILPACGGTANRSEVALTEGQKKGPGRLLRPGPNAQSSRPFWFSSALRSSSQNARIAVAIPRSVKRTVMPVERSTAKPSLPPLTFLMPPRDFEGKRYWRLPPLDLASSMPSRLSRRSSSPIRSGQSRMRPTSSILRATATRTRAFSERSACPFRAMSRSALPGCLAWTRELALPRSSCLRPYLSSRVRTVFTRDAAAFRAGPSSSLRPVSRSLRLMPRCTA